MRTKELVSFIKERESIRLKKEAGKKQPWTKDEILGTYRFCNVHREDDRVTRELNVLAPRENKDLWFWWVMARLFNKTETMAAIKGSIVPFKPDSIGAILHNRRERGPIFNGAYIVSTNGVAMDKVNYLLDRVLSPLWVQRKEMRPTPKDTLASFHARLMQFQGMGSFMAAQVVADLKYVKPLYTATDWLRWAASGPGSRRGLNRVMGNPVDAPWREAAWLAQLQELQNAVIAAWGEGLHAQDLQNCLCEFDKYERARLGEGRPKQLYKRSL